MKKVFRLKKWIIGAAIMMGYANSGFGAVASLAFPGAPLAVCGTQVVNRTVNVNFKMCESGTCNYVVCNIDPLFKATITLYKNGNLFSTHELFTSSTDFTEPFINVSTAANATFFANVKFERKRNVCFLGYETIANVTTSITTVGAIPATPDFNINGIAVPVNYTPIEVCASNIRINASATTCEDAYNITVEECDQWLVRTGQYEFGKWFTGTAPDNISLQQLAATYSYPPYFTGNVSRQGDTLLGGTLQGGGDRYYLVKVCTGIPSWNCKTALVRVLEGCKPGRDGVQEAEILPEDRAMAEALSSKGKSLSIAERLSDQVEVYPNPATEKINIALHGIPAQKICVYNGVGSMIFESNIAANTSVAEIDIASYPKGIYFLRINRGSHIIMKKFLKK